MFPNLLLSISFCVVLLLSLAVLRSSSGRSLLGWYAFVFAAIEPFLIFMNYTFDVAYLAEFAPFDDLIVDRMRLSYSFSNLIILLIFFLYFVIKPKYSIKSVINYNYKDIKFIYWVSLIIIIFSLISFALSTRGQLILREGLSGLGDYGSYYRVRYENSVQTLSLAEQYVNIIPLTTMLPLLSLYSMQRYMSKKSKPWMASWVFTFVLALVFSALAYAKSPIIATLMSNIILFLYITGSKVNRKSIAYIWYAIAAIIIVVLYYIVVRVTHGTDDVLDVLYIAFDRATTINVATSYNHFYVFPDIHPFTNYANSRTMNLFLALGSPGNTGGMSTFEIASLYLFGFPFNMNTGFVAASWAEFGYFGVVQATILVFGLALFWDVIFLRSAYTIPIEPILALFLSRVWQIHNNDMMFMITTHSLIFAPIYYILLFHKELHVYQVRQIYSVDTKAPLEPNSSI